MRAWVQISIASLPLVACGSDSLGAGRGDATEREDGGLDAARPTSRDGSTREPDANGAVTADAAVSREDAAVQGDASTTSDAAVASDAAVTSDAAVASDAASRADGSTFNDPWAGMCKPGLGGTYQSRFSCSSEQKDALIAAAIGPKRAFSFSIDSLTIDPPMPAGKPFTFSIGAGGFEGEPVNLELWGADEQCGTSNLEHLSTLQIIKGIACATFTPQRSHAQLMLVLRSNQGHLTTVHQICPDGQCVENMASAQEWPGKTQVFCDPEDLPNCEACLHDTCAAPRQYTVNGDVVASSCCGLTWQRQGDSDYHTWEAAKTYCQQLSLAGGGWRLPTVGELMSLVKSGSRPAIDGKLTGTQYGSYWTSMPARSSDWAWSVSFQDGVPYQQRTSSDLYVRCVR